jgi:DNA-binding IclR family transcriptional regulator
VTAEELIRAAEPILAELTESTGETTFISRRVGFGATSLAQQPSPKSLRVVLEPGRTGPLHVGAVALVLLAYAPADVADAALAEVAEAAVIRRALPRIVAAGSAQDDGLTFPGATTLAAPVLRDDGIVAALGVAAPAERASRGWQNRARRALRRATAELERSLARG